MHSLPNLLTAARLAAGLALAPLAVWPGGPLWTAVLILFVAAALTDWLDGMLARRFDAVSDLGELLDPLADKITMLGALAALMLGGVLTGFDGIAVVIILAREIAVSGARDFLARRAVPLPVTRLAKWKTAVQMIAVAVLLAGAAGAVPLLIDLGRAVLWAAVVLTVWTGIGYGRTVWRAGKARAVPGSQERHAP